MLKKIERAIIYTIETLATVLFVMVLACLIIQVFSRFVLKVSVPWTEEMARYLIVITSVLGGIICSYSGDHLGAYFLRDKAPRVLRTILFIFNSLLMVIMFAVIIYSGYCMWLQVDASVRAVSVKFFRLRWMYIGLIIGFAGMLFYAARDLVLSIRALFRNESVPGDDTSAGFPQKRSGTEEVSEKC